jgi:hypothetical protein
MQSVNAIPTVVVVALPRHNSNSNRISKTANVHHMIVSTGSLIFFMGVLPENTIQLDGIYFSDKDLLSPTKTALAIRQTSRNPGTEGSRIGDHTTVQSHPRIPLRPLQTPQDCQHEPRVPHLVSGAVCLVASMPSIQDGIVW